MPFDLPAPPAAPYNPYPFTPNSVVNLVWYDPDFEQVTLTDVPAQWLKPFITIGAARQIFEPVETGTGNFFDSTCFIRRVILQTTAPMAGISEFRDNIVQRAIIHSAEDRLLYIVDSIKYRNPTDPDGIPLWFCLVADNQGVSD